MGAIIMLGDIEMKLTYIIEVDSKYIQKKNQRSPPNIRGLLYGHYLNPLTDIVHIIT